MATEEKLALTAFPFTPELTYFERADTEWRIELQTVFGARKAGDAAYTLAGRGEPGSTLRKLYEERLTAMKAWESTRNN
jgi:hypothetical protein